MCWRNGCSSQPGTATRFVDILDIDDRFMKKCDGNALIRGLNMPEDYNVGYYFSGMLFFKMVSVVIPEFVFVHGKG